MSRPHSGSYSRASLTVRVLVVVDHKQILLVMRREWDERVKGTGERRTKERQAMNQGLMFTNLSLGETGSALQPPFTSSSDCIRWGTRLTDFVIVR